MKKFKFFVDGIKFQTEKQFLTGLEIKMMANVPEDLDLYRVRGKTMCLGQLKSMYLWIDKGT